MILRHLLIVFKIPRLLNRDIDVDEHIQNILSYCLTFFDKLILYWGLKSSIPQPRISAIDILAAFEKAYWKLEPTLRDNNKNLAAATLRSIALNYVERKGSKPPKTRLKSINKLKKWDDIVITKPDKGSSVVVMDKSECLRLLCEASIKEPTKFTPAGLEEPTRRGRPPKYYHPLLEKEKRLESVIRRILRKEIADSICKKSSRLAHLYGVPKTHKEHLAIPTHFVCNRYIQLRSGKVVGWEVETLIYQRVHNIRHLLILWRDPTSANRWQWFLGVVWCHSPLHQCSIRRNYSDFSKESIQWELV